MPSVAGPPARTLTAAVARMEELLGVALEVSRFYRTPCFPAGAGPDYVNAAAAFRVALDPGAVLDLMHGIEAEFGRERVQRWGRRTLDIDLIAAGDAILPDPQTHARWRALLPEQQIARTPDRLILPHPRLQDRAFVLVPLADVAPDWVHPVLGGTVRQMLETLPETAKEEVVLL